MNTERVLAHLSKCTATIYGAIAASDTYTVVSQEADVRGSFHPILLSLRLI